MAELGAKIRLFVDAALGPGAEVLLSADQAHYLFNVMRVAHGAEVAVFNGRDGEWLAGVTRTGKLRGSVACRAPGRPQRHPPDLWLVFAPVKKARTAAGDQAAMAVAEKTLDRAGRKRLIHPNAAARLKSRLAKAADKK